MFDFYIAAATLSTTLNRLLLKSVIWEWSSVSLSWTVVGAFGKSRASAAGCWSSDWASKNAWGCWQGGKATASNSVSPRRRSERSAKRETHPSDVAMKATVRHCLVYWYNRFLLDLCLACVSRHSRACIIVSETLYNIFSIDLICR